MKQKTTNKEDIVNQLFIFNDKTYEASTAKNTGSQDKSVYSIIPNFNSNKSRWINYLYK